MADTSRLNKRWAITAVVLGVVLPYGLLMVRFSLRNDQLEYFLPVRMYMRDAFRHGEFMLWNPFMSGSYPIHCDMQASVWNPITIVLTRMFDYNAWWLSVELLLYYVIGALGAFRFARLFSRNYYTCALIGIIYGCGGFGVSILEFMSWVGSFAYLPWAAYFFYRLLKQPDLVTGIGLGVALWLMLVSGYPSFLIYLGYCCVGLGLAYLWRLMRLRRRREVWRVLGFGLLALLFFVLLSLPAMQSFYEYLPYYGRGKHATFEHLNGEFFAWNYPASLIFPVAGTLVWDNDLYIGVVPVLMLGVTWRSWGFRDWVLGAGFAFTLLFTVGRSTPVRMWGAEYLPFMGAFGFSHSVGVFLVLAAFVWLAPRLDRVLEGYEGGCAGNGRILGRMRIMGRVLAGMLVVIWVLGYPGVRGMGPTVRMMYMISGIWQLGLLAAMGWWPWITATRWRVFFFVLADLMGSVLTVAPLTGFTVKGPTVFNREVAAFYRSDAREFLLDTTGKIERVRRFNPKKDVNAMKVVGRNNFPSHTQLDTFFNYVLDRGKWEGMMAKNFVYSADGTLLAVRDCQLGYNRIEVAVMSEKDCDMVIQQTWYRRWRAERPEYQPFAELGVFMAVRLRKGMNQVKLYYDCGDLWLEEMVSVATVLVLVGIVVFRRVRPKKAV